MASASGSWCTIESDPAVFTELIERVGVRGVQMEELYTLDSSEFERMRPVYGLIFLFKWSPGTNKPAPVADAPDVFFASQVVNNACATQAILSVLLNRPEVELGPELSSFKATALPLAPNERGVAIGANEVIRTVHNSFTRPEPISIEERRATDKDDVYHFISYVPVNGKLYELDGLRAGPVCHGDVPAEGDAWLEAACSVIQKRIALYSQAEIRFNLMAVTHKRADRLAAQLEAAREEQGELRGALMSLDDAQGAERGELAQRLEALESTVVRLESELAEEAERMARWKAENVRRKHNYVPFIFTLLKMLAEKGELVPLLEAAKHKQSSSNSSAQQQQQ